MDKLLDKLDWWMQPTDSIFLYFADKIMGFKLGGKTVNDRRIFIDNSSDILFVAHVDTVLPPKIKKRTKKRLHASGLDDRLGCLLAYELGTELQADILLTDDEEKCCSTAQYHICKNYNWVVEFDRAGNDVVTYGNESYAFNQALLKYWNLGFGSYSDIADLPTTACCFNLGIGYQHAHSKDSYVDLKVLAVQIIKFKDFYEKYNATKFVADENLHQEALSYQSIYDDVCDMCGGAEQIEQIHGYLICYSCFNQVINNFFFESDSAADCKNLREA